MVKGLSKDIAALGAVLAAVEGLEPAEQRWVFDAALGRLGLAQISPADKGRAPAPYGAPARGDGGKAPSPKDFLREKNPQSDVQRIACLAYYLNRYRDQPAFKTQELTALNIEAAGSRIGNPSQAVNNATKQSHYLAAAGAGRKQITAHGEEAVEALPDQAAVKVIDANRPKRRKGGRRRAAGARNS